MSRAPEESFRVETVPESDFRIGDRLVQPSLNRVRTPEQTFQLEPKIMRVLRCLSERPGEVVSKERLFAEVWQGTYVSEDVLTRAIAELRRVFEDSAAAPRVIETIRKSGYRLLLSPQPAEAAPAPPGVSRTAARSGPVTARAVLIAVVLAAAVATTAILLWSQRRASPARPPMRIRPLTSLPGSQRDPAISPDGTRVAFVWNGGSGDAYSLYVQLVDSESPLRLTREPGVEDRVPAWSPDGQKLAFTRSSRGECGILVVSSLGGAERTLGPCGDRDYRRLAWSPDGAWLAFSRRGGDSRLSIELTGVETGERRAVTRPPDGILGDSSPSFSPDGKKLAFARNLTEGVSDVYTVGHGWKRRAAIDVRQPRHDGDELGVGRRKRGLLLEPRGDLQPLARGLFRRRPDFRRGRRREDQAPFLRSRTRLDCLRELALRAQPLDGLDGGRRRAGVDANGGPVELPAGDFPRRTPGRVCLDALRRRRDLGLGIRRIIASAADLVRGSAAGDAFLVAGRPPDRLRGPPACPVGSVDRLGRGRGARAADLRPGRLPVAILVARRQGD